MSDGAAQIKLVSTKACIFLNSYMCFTQMKKLLECNKEKWGQRVMDETGEKQNRHETAS